MSLSKSYVIDQSDKFLLLADDIFEGCLGHSCFVFLVLFGQSWRKSYFSALKWIVPGGGGAGGKGVLAYVSSKGMCRPKE